MFVVNYFLMHCKCISYMCEKVAPLISLLVFTANFRFLFCLNNVRLQPWWLSRAVGEKIPVAVNFCRVEGESSAG